MVGIVLSDIPDLYRFVPVTYLMMVITVTVIAATICPIPKLNPSVIMLTV
jgi:hypothetical protein